MQSIRKFRVAAIAATASIAFSLLGCVGGPVNVDDYANLTSYDGLIQSIDANAELQQALSANITRTMRRGETVAEWSSTGQDFDKLIEAAPGGSDANALMNDLDGRTIFSSEKSLESLFANGYSTYTSSGPSDLFSNASDSVGYSLIYIADGVWLETAENMTKIGNASCSNGVMDAVRVHARRPFTSLTKLQKSYLASFLAASRQDDGTICTVAEPNGNNVWRSRFFLPNGTRLPVFDQEGGGTITIVSISEVNRMISDSR